MNIALDTKLISSLHFGPCKDGSQNNLTIFPLPADKLRCCACGNILAGFYGNNPFEVMGLKYDYEGTHILWACCDDECIHDLKTYLFDVMDKKEKDDHIDLMISCYRAAEKEYITPHLNYYVKTLPKGFDA